MNNKMELICWDGGLHLHEIDALDRIEEAFTHQPALEMATGAQNGGSLANQLGHALNRPVGGMFPWKGYAGFRFVDSKGYEGEFDLLLITHERVLIVELKDLKGKKVTCDSGKWYCDGYEKYRSPVSVTQPKVYLLKSKLEKIAHKFGNKKTPWIDFLVVLSNNNDYSSLPDQEKKHVMGIDEFIKLSDEKAYNKRFNPRRNPHKLNTEIDVFDKMILGDNVKPKHISVQNYITTVDDKIFPLPGQSAVYSEYVATSESNKNDKALLRQWDFNKLGDPGSRTPEGRFKIVSHERDVLVEIKNQAPDLYRYCLLPKTNPTSEEVTRQFHELYDLPADHMRFNEFINKYVDEYNEDERVTLSQVLLNQFSELHQANIAHRDIGDHSLWLSPSKKISLSSFISAYHQPLGTVGPRRDKLSVGVIPLPEDTGQPSSKLLGTPFHSDVYALGVVTQLILSGMRVTLENISIALDQIAESTEWYGDVLRKAVHSEPAKRFNNASEFRDAFSSIKPESEEYTLHKEEQLDIYRKKLNPYKSYPVDEELFDGDDKEAYISNDLVVRLWSDVNPTIDKPHVFQACLDFLSKADRLSSVDTLYLSKIEDYGIAPKTSQLFLIQEHVAGIDLNAWMSESHDIDDKRSIIEQLIRAIEYLHNIETYHGDLHPGNIVVSGEKGDYSIRFIDYLDFSLDFDKHRNHRYSPTNIDHATDRECDNFSVLRISAELLGIDWDDLDSFIDAYEPLVSAYKAELTGAGSLISLDRFKSALQEQFNESLKLETIEVVVRSGVDRPPVSILPDNEELFLYFDKAKKIGEIKLRFSGIGGSIDFFYKPADDTILGNTPLRDASSVSGWDRNKSQLVINARLHIAFDNHSNYSLLDKYLKTLEGIEAICNPILQPSVTEKESEVTVRHEDKSSIEKKPEITSRPKPSLSQPKETFIHPISAPEIEKTIKSWPKPREIWKAMIETEVDALPTVTIAVAPEYDQRLSMTKFQYSSSDKFLDRYSLFDDVELIRRVDDKEYFCGKLNIKESNTKYLYLTSVSQKTKFKVDDTLYLRTSMERSSYIRRKKAVNRILDKTSVITNLVEYFGQCGEDKMLLLSKPPSDEDFSVYDRDDGHGGTISLNDQQRSAFSKLVSNGPVSLLQGPPGTGKTEFIAAFTHYLITKEGANHILLVSQSHEAVNTAAERVRQHCREHETDLDIVRFSNKSSNISSGLIDAYSVYLVEERLEQFRAQYSERILSLQPAMNLPITYVDAVIEKELTLTKRLQALRQVEVDISDLPEGSDDRKRLITTSSSIFQQITSFCAEKYNLEVDGVDIEKINIQVNNTISSRFGIAPNESKRMNLLVTLVNDYMDRLDTNPGSFEEFLARSRTLVCGTCVGIGVGHLSVSENQYDWVIIDEAARSVSSELAIAMQSGKRILLVGDHKQLPPTYQEDHKKELSRRLKLNRNDPDFDWVLKSDFERAFESGYGKAAGAKLLIQYRMAKPIGTMVSDVFYDSELKNGERYVPEIYNNLTGPLASSVSWLDISSLGNMARSQTDNNHSSYNSEEANQIISLLKDIDSNKSFLLDLADVADDEPAIGVICMYAAQKRLLFRKFNEHSWSENFHKLVKIDTVDSYQGKENRVIIVSTTLNTNDRNPRFLRTLNRINVAMSRAMDKLVIVGATDMWKGNNSEYPLGKIASYIQKNQGDDYRFIKATNSNSNGGRKHAQ
jgi:serine/threonine protein kinase